MTVETRTLTINQPTHHKNWSVKWKDTSNIRSLCKQEGKDSTKAFIAPAFLWCSYPGLFSYDT